MFKMLEHNPEMVLGIDPVVRFLQFKIFNLSFLTPMYF